MTTHRASLLQRTGKPLIVPGIADTLGALCAQDAGFEAVFLAGSAVAQFHLGRPDIGLLSAAELVDVTRRITERTDLPVIVDIDTGFGNAFNVFRTVRSMALAGAACVQLEDQHTVKPVSDALSRPVIPLEDMVAKIRAAIEARGDFPLLISARTDARYTQGCPSAIERAQAYVEAGADLIFVEGLKDAEERAQLSRSLPANTPKVFNAAILDLSPPEVVEAIRPDGYQIILFPTVVPRAATHAITQSLGTLATSVAGQHAGGRGAEHTGQAPLQSESFLAKGLQWQDS